MAATGTLRDVFQDVFLLAGKITDNIATTFDFGGSTAYGSGATSIFAWPLTNTPEFDPGQEHWETAQNTGVAQATLSGGNENLIIRRAPTTTYEWHANAYNLAVPVRALFQRGYAEGSTPFVKTHTIPVSRRTSGEGASPEFYAYLCHYMGNSDNISIDGAIVTSLTLSCDNQGPLTASATFLGKTLTIDKAMTYTPTFGANPPLLWRNAHVGWRQGAAPTSIDPVDCSGFSVTITNNAVARFYNNLTPQRMILQKYAVSGSLKFPYDASAGGYLSGTDPITSYLATTGSSAVAGVKEPYFGLNIYWTALVGTTTPTAAGELSIQLMVVFDKPTLGGDSEKEWDCPFKGYLVPSVGSAVSIILCDNLETV